MDLKPEQVKTFIDGFKYDSAITGDVERKYLAHYVNIADKVAEGTQTYNWELLGYKVADASVEFNWDEETVTDITGATYKTIKKSEPEMTLDGYIINKKSTFLEKLTKKAIRNAYTEFADNDILTVYFWLSKDGKYLAKMEKGCSIVPSSIGGEGNVGITPVITFSNKATFGSVDKGVGTAGTELVFTEGNVPA